MVGVWYIVIERVGSIYAWSVPNINAYRDSITGFRGISYPLGPRHCVSYSEDCVWMVPNYRNQALFF